VVSDLVHTELAYAHSTAAHGADRRARPRTSCRRRL